MSDVPMSERLADLEVRLTFMDDSVSSLVDADATLSRRLMALEQGMRDLRAELASIRNALSDDPHSEPPPPHY